MSLKNARLVKSLSILIMFTVLLQCFPTATLAFELKGLKESVRTFVEKRDNAKSAFKNTINKYYNFTNIITSKFVKEAFSIFESKTGVDSENKLYNVVKKHSQEKIGFKLGGGKALKNMGFLGIDFGLDLLTSPIGIIDLGFKVKDNPQRYKNVLRNGAISIAGVILNPLPVAKKLYQDLVTVPDVAKQDPLEMGKLKGEYGTYGVAGIMLAGSLKAPQTIKSVLNTAKKTGVSTKLSAFVNKIDIGVKFLDINLGFAPTPVAAGAGKGISTKVYKISSSLKASSIALSERTGKISTVEKYVADNYPVPIKKINNKYDSLFKIDDPEFSWIKNSDSAPNVVRDKLMAWGNREFQKWGSILSNIEQDTIRWYTDSSRKFNAVLRGIDKQYMVGDLKRIDLLSNSLRKSVLPEMLVFRGTDKRFLGDLAKLSPEKLIGKTIEEKGFLSTSLFPERSFIDDVAMIIRVPRGVNGAYLGDLSKHKKEAEVLLDHGQKMVIKELKSLEDEHWYPDGLHMVVELLPKFER